MIQQGHIVLYNFFFIMNQLSKRVAFRKVSKIWYLGSLFDVYLCELDFPCACSSLCTKCTSETNFMSVMATAVTVVFMGIFIAHCQSFSALTKQISFILYGMSHMVNCDNQQKVFNDRTTHMRSSSKLFYCNFQSSFYNGYSYIDEKVEGWKDR